MTIQNCKIAFCSACFILSGCAGVRVIGPNDQNKDAGTLALDLTTGKLAATHSCNIVASNGRRVSANGKTEDEARKETLAKCRDQTAISFCDSKNLKCQKN